MFAHIENKIVAEYPIAEQEIRARFPWVIFPVVFVPPDGYVEVLEVPQPTYDPIAHELREIDPALIGKVWTQQWEVVAYSPEIAEANRATALKAKREAMVTTPWKIREALDEKGWLGLVETAVAAADGKAQRAWKFAQEFKRLDPLAVSIQTALKKTDVEMDALFELAMTL